MLAALKSEGVTTIKAKKSRDHTELMFKYYWDQTIFFNLEQGSNLKKRPTIIQIVKN